ncbi:oligosaccharide flippase family protein [Photobacterium angustum]|uniref:Polysaccharide biosynthesis protein n=1 Tax=Photobacterium angustum TaxID=661 RepID=A0A2S7VXK4_PHOAN|nr:oligosaccharide flippase family protein [Photobacterium angustum]PQJ66264.1 hypothetical protein BTO08_01940 [Photobacterium angustum]
MKKFLFNSAWLVTDRALFLLGSFIISVYVGKYLGPSKLGVVTYALSISSVLIALIELGANHSIYNRAARNKKSAINLIESTFKLRIILFFIFYFFSILFLSTHIHNQDDFIVSSVIVFSALFTGLDTYQYYYNATLKSKINAISSQISFAIVFILRYLFVYYEIDFAWFSIVFLLQPLLTFLIRFFYFRKKVTTKKKNRVDKKAYVRYTIKTGSSLVLSALSIVIYTKVNNFVIQYTLGDESLGYFSIALQLGLVWLFIPNAIIMSFLTKIIKNTNDLKIKGISFIILIVIAVSIPFIILFFFFSDFIVEHTYGDNFMQASSIIWIIAVSGIFSCVGYLNNRVISSIGEYKFLLFKTIFVSFVSVPLSYFLTINYGIKGSAISILIVEFMSATFINYYNCKPIMYSQLKLLNGFSYIKMIK